MPYYREALSKFKDINQNPDTQYANIVHAGQLGVASDLRKIDACTPLALPSIIPVVIHIPNMFKKIQFMPELLKEIIERHAKSITGLEFGYTLEDGEGSNKNNCISNYTCFYISRLQWTDHQEFF